jgi:hypothetical protein
VQATDDYGISSIDLTYSANGGPEKTVALQSGGKRLREVVAGHTFFLEELGLKPGDLVSYYARAKDNGGNGQEAKTDIYFMSVRPFDQTYKQADQAGGGDGGDGPGELTERQRQVVAGTFNVERDRKTTAPNRLRENFATLNLSQGRIREAVETLARRIAERNITAIDTVFRIIAEELPQAAKEMQAAEEQLLKRNSTDALPPEQRALQHLQRADAAFKEYQISRGQPQGGASGNQQSKAEDLADLFELDADKLRNQYETVERGSQQQQADNQVDEAAEKLKQLASRLQQENERLKNGMRGQPGQQSGGGGGSQRELADQAEQMARQLERLTREHPTDPNNDKIAESARRLQDAANAMRRSATGANDGGVSQGASALDRLQEARRLLDENRNARTGRDLDDAVKKAEQIANDQRGIAEDMDKLGKTGATTGDAGAERLAEREKALEGDVRQLESQLDRMRRDSKKDHPAASDKMSEALTSMRENRLADRVQAGQRLARALVQGRTSPEYAKQFESAITDGIDEMRQKVNEAAGAAKGEAVGQGASKSLDRARDLVRSQESLSERMRQRRLGEGGKQPDSSQAGGQGSRGAQGNQQGQNGQQGQQGVQGGQQGQNGQQQGQNGQQGQGGQQQGKNGQQGQGQQGQGQGQQGQGQQGQGQGQGQGQNGQQGQGGGRQQGQGGQMGGGSQSNQQGPGGRLGGNTAGGAPNGQLSADDIRQFSREFRDQRQSAEALKKELQQMGVDPSDLNRMIEQMRQLENGKNYDDPASLERLQDSLIEGLKAFEFALRRQVEKDDKGRPVLGGAGDVPAGFRQMVDEYYRSLSKKPQK